MSKKKLRQLQREQARAKQQQQRRLMYTGGGIAVALVLIGLGFFLTRGPGSAPVDPNATARCGDVETLPEEGRGHIQPGETPVYQVIPPTSGNHNPDPLPQGVYDSPVDVTRVVHSEEHGYVILWYNNSLPADQIAQLQAIGRGDGRKIIVAPYPNMPSKVALTAWDHRQTCDGVNTQAIRSFIAQFRDQGPEQTPF